MLRRRWMACCALMAPFLTALTASCVAGGGNPFGAYVLPQALPSPVLGYGTMSLKLDGAPHRFERAVYFTPGNGHFGVRPDEIGPPQRPDIFLDEVAGQRMNFRLEVPGLTTPGPLPSGATLEIVDQSKTPPVTYNGPITVYLQQAGAKRGYPVMGTFSGTLSATDGSGRQVAVSDGQFHGHLATDV